MADISLIQDVCMDDCDEGVYEQGDGVVGSPGDDEPPLYRVKRLAGGNVYNRQSVAHLVQDLFRSAPAEILDEGLISIMEVIKNLGEKDEPMVRAFHLEQVPHMAALAIENSHRVDGLGNVVSDYLLPLVVYNLGCSDNAVDKAAHSTLIQLMEEGLITKPQAEIQVCPAILALSNQEQTADINTGAITLMSKMAPLLGRDVTERVFLKRFTELCTSHMFYVRKFCAAHIGHFCAVLGREQFEKVLLPCYLALCQDDIWGVRKACAEVIMFVSAVTTPAIRQNQLAPTFAKLLQDDCRWVQMSAFQTLGPFISTFAEPPITNIVYNNQAELVFINKDGCEFLMNSPSAVPDVRFCSKIYPKQNLNDCCSQDVEDLYQMFKEESNNVTIPTDTTTSSEEVTVTFEPHVTQTAQMDEDIKEIVETVKNAVLNCRNVEQERGVVVGDTPRNLSNANVISDTKSETCDNVLGSTISNKLMEPPPPPPPDDVSEIGAEDGETPPPPPPPPPVVAAIITVDGDLGGGGELKTENQVILNSERRGDDDSINMYNSYNYWYISPDMPLDLDGVAGEPPLAVDEPGDTINVAEHLEDLYSNINLNDTEKSSSSLEETSMELKKAPQFVQDVVPEVLIYNFLMMTDSSFSTNIDSEMSYHCAYSLPAVALTLGPKNWPLLKETIEDLAGDMQYKVRHTVASCLHELALIFGREVATQHLTPIFDGFIKDLDEVRIGILKHLAYFLRLIEPEKRLQYLPRLQDFLKTENESNWRFRHELAKQLLDIVTLFTPVDSAKHIGLIAEVLLHDVSAVRQIAISLITELLKYISTKPGLDSLYLVRLVEKFAHSKKWKRRQTFALLCWNLLSCEAIPPEQFANEIMAHLLDLSWDPVANVRLVVAKTIAQHIIPNEYFSNPSNQHFDNLGTVLRRLQADKDRDVRQYAEVFEGPPSPTMSALANYN